jgi:hypothetical protein
MDKRLVEKWNQLLEAKTETIKPVTDRDQKAIIAQLLENQENWLNENQVAASDIGVFTPILIPTTRRIFPALLANQIVGVQPMSAPTGYAFAWRASYAGDKSATGSVDQAVQPLHRGQTEDSINGPQFKSVVLLHASFTGNIAVGDEVRDASSGGGNLHGLVKYFENTDGYVKVLVEYGMTGDSINFPIAAGDTVYYETADATGRATVSLFNNETGYNLILRNYAGPVTTAAGEVLGETGTEMKQMRVQMERVTVTAQTRKLKAEYTLEMAQDLKAMHNMDAEAELMNVLQYEIAAEIDRDLVAAINNNATSTNGWVYGNVGAQTNTAWLADGQWEVEKFRSLYTRVIKEANRIAVTTRRGAGNFIICSTNVVSALEGLNNFLYSSVPNDVGPVGGVTRVGTLDGRFSVYVDTFSDLSSAGDYITVGYKGPSNLDSGVIYCPYIPLMMQKVIHEETFQPAIGVLTRSAIAYNLLGTNNYYRQIPVDFTNSQLA